MAKNRFPVEILTPEGEVFNEEVEMVSTRTATGSIGVLANHQPILTMLEPTELRLYRSDSDVVRFAQGEGYMQVYNNRALMLLEDATPPEELDRGDLQDRLRQAEQTMERSDDGSEEYRTAARRRRRLQAFLEIAGD